MARTIALVVLAGVVAVSACSRDAADEPGNRAGEPTVGNIAHVTDSREIALPLDAYRLTREQEALVSTANDMLIRDCMKRFGFSWRVQDRTVAKEPNRRYGISVADDYARNGYHPGPEFDQGGQPKPGSFQPPSDAEDTVFKGDGPGTVNGQAVPKGGCQGEAGEKLRFAGYGDTPKDGADELVQRLDTESNLAARADSRVRAAWDKWRQCMDEAGFDYADPWAANDDPRWSAGPQPTDGEIATAKADIGCRDKANVLGTNLAVETAYQTRVVEGNAEVLREHRGRLDERVRTATEVVAVG